MESSLNLLKKSFWVSEASSVKSILLLIGPDDGIFSLGIDHQSLASSCLNLGDAVMTTHLAL
jgi:hypothetical protein